MHAALSCTQTNRAPSTPTHWSIKVAGICSLVSAIAISILGVGILGAVAALSVKAVTTALITAAGSGALACLVFLSYPTIQSWCSKVKSDLPRAVHPQALSPVELESDVRVTPPAPNNHPISITLPISIAMPIEALRSQPPSSLSRGLHRSRTTTSLLPKLPNNVTLDKLETTPSSPPNSDSDKSIGSGGSGGSEPIMVNLSPAISPPPKPRGIDDKSVFKA